jgi:hypothetical protein
LAKRFVSKNKHLVNEYSSFAIFLFFFFGWFLFFGYHIQKLSFKKLLYTTSYACTQACLSRAMKFGRDPNKKNKK